MKKLLFLAGNQLFDPKVLHAYRKDVVVMVEDAELCRRLSFHQVKLGLILGAMREHAIDLKRRGFDVRYFEIGDRTSVRDALQQTATQTRAQRLVLFDSEDRWLVAMAEGVAIDLGMSTERLCSPMFLLGNAALDEYFNGAKKPRMASFYRSQRKRMRLLMDGGRPLGGKWSFDSANRQKIPVTQPIPDLPPVVHSQCTQRLLKMVETQFPDHPGKATELWLPTTRDGAHRWLDKFLEERLIGFGSFEDALTSRSPVLFHSVLSPFMNIGLVTPDVVVERALAAGEEFRVPLNDLEGFLRQIVGWREFVRGIYRRYGQTMRQRNVWTAERRLTSAWADAATGLFPLDKSLAGARDRAWNHHIERLMVIANVMNLAEIHPDDVYRFFMTHYVDAYDWVMVPNVFGMGLTSDGGVFASKPYICGSNYIRKMSDYPSGDWTSVLDGLYWRFVAKHRRALSRNPRVAMVVRTLEAMDRSRLKRILGEAEDFIERNTRSSL